MKDKQKISYITGIGLFICVIFFITACKYNATNYNVNNTNSGNLVEFCGTSYLDSCVIDSDCATAGCSGQICKSKTSENDGVSTCEWRDCYKDEDYGLTCGCLDEKCAWHK